MNTGATIFPARRGTDSLMTRVRTCADRRRKDAAPTGRDATHELEPGESLCLELPDLVRIVECRANLAQVTHAGQWRIAVDIDDASDDVVENLPIAFVEGSIEFREQLLVEIAALSEDLAEVRRSPRSRGRRSAESANWRYAKKGGCWPEPRALPGDCVSGPDMTRASRATAARTTRTSVQEASSGAVSIPARPSPAS
jgi:hypothetical protein